MTLINLDVEKNRALSTKQICQIEDFAIQSANDGGFLNSYIFERALYVYAAILLLEDKKEDIRAKVTDEGDICAAFDYLISSGLLEQMVQDYPSDIEMLLQVGEQWLKEVETYEHSARGLLDTISTLSGDIVQSAVNQLTQTADGNVNIIQQFAEQWGYGRKPQLEVLEGDKA